MNPFPLCPSLTLTLAPALAGPVDRYALMALAGEVTVAEAMRYDKRAKSVHRYDIADTRGLLRLTVPVAKPVSATAARWCDVRVSDHGEWWPVHMTALESAYGRTPYFEFYADRFKPFFADYRDIPITDFDREIEATVCSLLTLRCPVYSRDSSLRLSPLPPRLPAAPQYWQVRADRLGFIGGLSILDLLFNLGPEAPLYLLGRARSLAPLFRA